jgi:single-strand DNA-binding protein
VSFFDIEVWGDLAKISAKKGQRGVRIRAVGRIKQNRWTGSDGKNYSRICIIADHIEFIKKPKEESSIEEIPEHSSLIEEVETKEELIVF